MIPHYLANPPKMDDAMRYDFPLGPDSIIIEAGSYQGQWADIMARKYPCRIYTFEPVHEFFATAQARLACHPKVVISNCGLANSSRQETWKIRGDSTGAFATEGPEQEVLLIDFIGWLDAMVPKMPACVDLLAVNCEGGEYELLEAIIVTGNAHRFQHIMVQFHDVGLTPQERKRGIRESLSKTHRLKFFDPIYWECWELMP